MRGEPRQSEPRREVQVMARTGWATRVSVGAVLTGLLWTSAPVARADATTCSYGNAQALFQAFPPLFNYQPREDFFPECQYRLFLDGEHVTFDEDDWFVAGIVLYVEYQQLGETREAGIADIEKYGNRLWLSEIGADGQVGTPVEQSLMETTYKDLHTADLGLIVYKHFGVILHLPPGDYLSTWESSYEGEVVDLAEVTLHVLPTK
jgi:hypothetical protein